MHRFKREARNEYCSTVTRTFVQDCSSVTGMCIIYLIRSCYNLSLRIFTVSSRSSLCLIESGKPRCMISYTKLHNTNFNSDFCYIHFIVISQFSHLHSGLSQNRSLARGTENIFSEDDLRSRIFGSFVVKFLARLPLLGFSNI